MADHLCPSAWLWARWMELISKKEAELGLNKGGRRGAGCSFQLPKGVAKGRQRQAPGSKNIRGHGCQ